jgi:gliding motility-associated lipoprotein GldK
MGSYNMGASDQDVPWGQTQQGKTVSIQAFYMDQTELTNNEYRQFVYYVRDSIARRILGENVDEEYFFTQDDNGDDIDPPNLNWKKKIKWDGDDEREALADMFVPENERFYRRKEIDTRKLLFEYYWIDLKEAARKATRAKYIKDRSSLIKKDIIAVYPDTLCWIHDFSYSYNEPMTNMYFWHPGYDDYPVVGVSWKQATAFCIWRTQFRNDYLASKGEPFEQNYRLPTESEWEYASRGGFDLSPYPWGGPYIRNSNGCFLGNYKPMRGNYIDDGGFHTVKAYEYNPNNYGLYCMAGNVSEWTSNAFDESAYSFTHDLNPDYQYDAKDNEHYTKKRKVIRGGSWKDIGYYLQTGSRTYEYQDTAKAYVGFRCVISYIGRDKNDDTRTKNGDLK